MQIVEEKYLADRRKREIKIRDKVLADGVGGELHAFIPSKSIDLDDNITAIELAITKEILWKNNVLFAENKNEFYHSKMEFVKTVIRGIGSDLKVDINSGITGMGLWGFTTEGSDEIDYPTEERQWLDLWNAIYEKYDSYPPGTAPIEHYIVSQHWVMTTINDEMILAEGAHDDAIEFYLQSYIAKEAMEAAMVEPDRCDGLIIEKLKVLHPNDMRSLGLYLIKTSNAKTSKHIQVSKIDPVSGKVISNLVKPGVLESLVGWDLHVFQGKTTTGTYRTLTALGKLPIGDGQTESTIFNPNETEVAKVKSEIWRLASH